MMKISRGPPTCLLAKEEHVALKFCFEELREKSTNVLNLNFLTSFNMLVNEYWDSLLKILVLPGKLSNLG